MKSGMKNHGVKITWGEQAIIARKAKITPQMIYAVLNGKRRPSRELAKILFEVTKIDPVVWLYSDTSVIREKVYDYVVNKKNRISFRRFIC